MTTTELPTALDGLDLSDISARALFDVRNKIDAELTKRLEADLISIVETFAGQQVASGEVEHDVVGAKFDVTEYENGWFYDSNVITLALVDGSETTIYDVDETFGDVLTELSDVHGPLTRKSDVEVDLVKKRIA